MAVVCGALWFYGRIRRVQAELRSEKVEAERPRSWSGVAGGVAFTAYGVAAVASGRADVELVKMEGPHIRYAGALLCIVGVVIAVSAVKRR